jgi:hypothetical protein
MKTLRVLNTECKWNLTKKDDPAELKPIVIGQILQINELINRFDRFWSLKAKKIRV